MPGRSGPRGPALTSCTAIPTLWLMPVCIVRILKRSLSTSNPFFFRISRTSGWTSLASMPGRYTCLQASSIARAAS